MLTVIIEACDCVGKSTLIGKLHQAIASAYPDPSVVHVCEEHFTYPPKNLSKEDQIEHQRALYTKWAVDLTFGRLAPPKVFLFDRFMTGELIYGPLYRDYTPDYIHDLEMILSVRDTYYVTLCASENTIKERFDGEFIDVGHIKQINDEFIRKHMDCRIRRKMLLNVDNLNADEVFNKVYNFIQPGLARHVLGQMYRKASNFKLSLTNLRDDGALDFKTRESLEDAIVINACTKLNHAMKISELKECVAGYAAGTAPGKFTYGGRLTDGAGVAHTVQCTEFFISSFDEVALKVVAIPSDIDAFANSTVTIHGGDIMQISFFA